MKFTFLLGATFLVTNSLYALSIIGKTYEGCASTKQEALYTLSGNIQSRVSTYIQQTVVVSGDDNVKSKISDYTSSATNLSLVNIEYKNKKKEICAVVHKADQISNTHKLLKQALHYDEKNLPKDIDAKIEKLSLWLENIKQLSFLIPSFLSEEDTTTKEKILNKKEKIFTDIYTKSIAYSDSLFFKSCKSTKEKAQIALNKKLFSNGKKDEKKGFLDTITSVFSSDDSRKMLDIFDTQIIEVKKDKDICLMIKKAELLKITQKMYADVMRVSAASLSKNPVQRYKNIQDNLYEQLSVLRALMKLYPKYYSSSSFEQVNAKRKLLTEIQEKTFPQYVQFTISGAENISISVDNHPIKNNEKHYIKKGEHTYKIEAKGKCPIIESFENDLFEDKVVSEDLTDREYPTVIFQTDKEPSIVLNGEAIQANMTQSIKQCKGEARYLVKYANQNVSGEVDTTPGAKNTVVLNFLTSDELTVFSDAKTKHFTTTSQERFTESLTAVNSDNLVFRIKREPEHGEATLYKSGSFEYVSKKGFVGVDTFSYVIETPQKTSAPKLVSIKVGASLQSQATITKPSIEKQAIVPSVQKKPTVSYEAFKAYVESKELTVELMKKLKKKFPEHFERLRKEMTHQ